MLTVTRFTPPESPDFIGLVHSCDRILLGRDDPSSNSLQECKKEVRRAQLDLYEKLKNLRRLESSKNSGGIPAEALANICQNYYGVAFTSTGVGLNTQLAMDVGPIEVMFHTGVKNDYPKCNDGIIYVTMPIYSFKAQFSGNNLLLYNATEGCTPFNVFTFSTSTQYGHPHANYETKRDNNLVLLSNLCTGNNDFQAICAKRNKDSADVILMFRKIVMWFLYINYLDSFSGKFLYKKVLDSELTEWLKSDEALTLSERLFHHAQTVLYPFLDDDYNYALDNQEFMTTYVCHQMVPEDLFIAIEDTPLKHFTRRIFNRDDEKLPDSMLHAYQFAYALWLHTHMSDIPTLQKHEYITNAILTDIGVFDVYKVGSSFRRKILRSPRELKNLCSDRRSTKHDVMSQIII